MRINKELIYVLLAELFILIPSTAHIILCSHITTSLRIPFCVLSGLFAVIDSYFLLSTALRNPGYLPKCYTTIDLPIVVEVKNQTFTLKPCDTCKTLKDLRTHHCKVCDFCVDRLDHHCPWVANCIGRRNHRHFMLLLISTTLHCIYLFIGNVIEVSILHPPPGHYGGEAILIIISVVLGWSLGSLLCYQSYLVASNQTTHESRRKLFKTNPFYSSLFRNCVSFWKMSKDDIREIQGDKRC